ncbi:MAG: tail fiber domain-containing protein [Flavobacteriales bacterium]|nr:tail fiber domain-containing protein [Flavobacteriales bacterium]
MDWLLTFQEASWNQPPAGFFNVAAGKSRSIPLGFRVREHSARPPKPIHQSGEPQYGHRSERTSKLQHASGNTVVGNEAPLPEYRRGDNTAVGIGAMFSNSSGSLNTAIGSGKVRMQRPCSNTTALGSGASCTAGNQRRVGNSLSTIIGAVPFAPASDARFKRNIQEECMASTSTMKLRPVTYNFDAHKTAVFLKEEDMRYDQNGERRSSNPPHPDMVAARDQKGDPIQRFLPRKRKRLRTNWATISVPL